MSYFHDFLKRHCACSDASTFVGKKSLREAWDTCPRADWMLWLLDKAGYKDDRMYRLFAAWCACNTPLPDGRVTWDLLTDKRSRDAVKVAIRFANGEASRGEMEAAGSAARWAAYWAAYWAADSAADWAAHWAADSAADSAARLAARKAQADHLRTVVNFKKLERLIKWAQRKGTTGASTAREEEK